MRRIIVTGSRSFKDVSRIESTLRDQFAEGPFVLVHGGCSTGADAIAHRWYLDFGKSYGCQEEIHAANWVKYGGYAGLQRNTEMVGQGADLVIAFLSACSGGKSNCPKRKHYSHGTTHCVNQALKAMIPVIYKYDSTLIKEN